MEIVKADLGIGIPYIKGRKNVVKKCWHFYTDGKAVDVMFYDEKDFSSGINRIYVVLGRFDVVILAFVLMDTHIHFVLYGDFDDCNRFVHEYIRRTSAAISHRHGDKHKMCRLPIGYQAIRDEDYLKTVICYVIKNPTTAGMRYSPYDYPWSSGPLYFRSSGLWCSPHWSGTEDGQLRYHGTSTLADMPVRDRRQILGTKDSSDLSAQMVDGTVFPGTFVRTDLVEAIFRSHRSFQYFMCRTKDDDVELRESSSSFLSIPIQELRQHKTELCMRMFGVCTVKKLSMHQRLQLARKLKAIYNSSSRQIARLCGLIYEEVSDKI